MCYITALKCYHTGIQYYILLIIIIKCTEQTKHERSKDVTFLIMHTSVSNLEYLEFEHNSTFLICMLDISVDHELFLTIFPFPFPKSYFKNIATMKLLTEKHY